jgi:hypothetical protein
MSKTTRVIIAVVIVLILIGGVYLIFGKKSSNPLQSVQNSVQNKVAQMTTQKMSLSDFFSLTGSKKCTFSDKSNNSSGTVYIGRGKMRGDFQSTDNDTTNSSHMINDGQYFYIWTDGQKGGYKISTETMKKQAAQVTMSPDNTETQPSAGPVDMNQQADYSCGGWSVDTSMFILPQGVTFTDYSSMMQGMQNGTTPGTMQQTPASQGMTAQQKQSECTQCNKVPAGAMRNQCLSELKC